MTTVAWQRFEGALFCAAAVLWLWGSAPDWPVWLWVALALAPDLSMLGYIFGPRIGAAAYNAAHLYAGGALLAGIGNGFGFPALWTDIGLIWLAHVGVDRALGYGLKEATGFTDTHLGRIGRDRGR
jgi:hypothetical protein